MNEKITADEFERRYAQRSRVTVELLRDALLKPIPCNCGEVGCDGWVMVGAYDREFAKSAPRETKG